MNALEFSNVSKTFGSRNALDGVSFALPQGASLGLLGPNGAGKTTSLRLLLGFTRASSGSVTVRGEDPQRAASREGLGYLPERLRLPQKTTLRAFLELQGKLGGLAGQALKQEVDEISERTGIADRLDERLADLSKGLAQRAGFAQALIGRPSLLLLDEPNSGLDPIGMREARGWIESARERGCSVLVCSHVLSEIERVCDRVAIFNRGRICAEGAIDELVKSGESLEDAFVRIVEAAP
jgi:ABC-2 type transport system ATP-binding protein